MPNVKGTVTLMIACALFLLVSSDTDRKLDSEHVSNIERHKSNTAALLLLFCLLLRQTVTYPTYRLDRLV